jgi:hypothetical protein
MIGDWKLFLRDSDEEEANKIRGHAACAYGPSIRIGFVSRIA